MEPQRVLAVAENVRNGPVRLARVKHRSGGVVAKLKERDRRFAASGDPAMRERVGALWRVELHQIRVDIVASEGGLDPIDAGQARAGAAVQLLLGR